MVEEKADNGIAIVLMLADLNGEETAHSALENYTWGAASAFITHGLSVEAVDSGTRWLLKNRKIPVKKLSLQRMSRRTVLKDHLSALWLAIRHFKNRRRSVLFIMNVARSYIGIVWAFKMLGFPVVYWIMDYYPERKLRINATLRNLSDLNICINSYIAEQIGFEVPTEIFHGGTNLPPPSRINRSTEEAPLRLFYAGTLNKLNGVDKLLEVAASSEEKWSLELFGSGELSELAEWYSNKYSNITTHGLKPREDVISALHKANVAFCIRRLEGDYYRHFFPSKLVELIASPAQIIASDMKEITDPFNDALVICNSCEVDHVKDALEKIRNIDRDTEAYQLKAREQLIKDTLCWNRLPIIVSNVRR